MPNCLEVNASSSKEGFLLVIARSYAMSSNKETMLGTGYITRYIKINSIKAI